MLFLMPDPKMCGAVSYTHLIIGQVKPKLLLYKPTCHKLLNLIPCGLVSPVPVSYTHLAVYKRQAHVNSRTKYLCAILELTVFHALKKVDVYKRQVQQVKEMIRSVSSSVSRHSLLISR